VGFVVAILVAPPLAALGVILGVGMAILNLRFLDSQAVKVEMRGEQNAKAIRRQLGSKTTFRLAAMTIVVLAAVFLNAPLGIGIVSGLVLYQLVFVVNVMRVVTSQGGMG
jgi:4-hydroxybenzoate polyprenyltransferase